MNDKCKTCKHYSTNSRDIDHGRKERIGNFCVKYGWNLDRFKTWIQNGNKRLNIPQQKLLKFAPMTTTGAGCYEPK